MRGPINPDGNNGLFYGNPQQFAIQALTVLATWAFAFLGTLVIGKAVDAVMGLRVHEEDEHAGLDLSQHNENAYALGMMGEGGHLAGHGLPAGPMGHPADESRHARPAPAGRPPA